MITFKDILAIIFFGSGLYGLIYLLDYAGKSVQFGEGIGWAVPLGIFGCFLLMFLLIEYLKYRSSQKTSKEKDGE